MPDTAKHSRVRFGDFSLDLRAGELRKHGIKIKLSGQPLDILALLLQQPGEVVTREELRAKLWPADTFVDFDHGLGSAINRLREALHDSADAPRFIETLPRRGFRFLAPVEAVAGPSGSAEAEPAKSSAAARRGEASGARRLAVGAGLALVVAFAAYLAWERFHPGGQAPADKIRLAVLPFENLSGDPEQDYFSDGVTEEMITQLGRLDPQRLGVTARSSVIRYKRTAKPADEIGRELGVQYILEGSVRRDAGRVRIAAQLIQVRDQSHLWAEGYDRDLRDILTLESEVARAIACQIRLTLTAQQQVRLAGARPMDALAYQAYLKGRYHWNRRTTDGLQKSVEYFEEAIRRDPGYALAYAGLADSYNILGNFNLLPPVEAYPKAKAAARRALELDESLGEAHTALAFATYLYDKDWATAEKGFQRAIQFNPNYGPLHQWYGVSLASRGRKEEAIAEAKRAQEAEPLSLIINAVEGWISYQVREYDRTIEQCRKTLELDPDFPAAHLYLGLAYTQTGKYDEAIGELRKTKSLYNTPYVLGALGHAYARAGRVDEAHKVLREMLERSRRGYFPPYFVASVYAGLGEKDAAFEWLQKANDERYPWLVLLRADPMWDTLHSDPRFADLLRRIGLPP